MGAGRVVQLMRSERRVRSVRAAAGGRPNADGGALPLMRAIQASLLGLLLGACLGGQTGQPDSEDCLDEDTPSPSETLERFAGRYESPATAPNNRAECPPEADAVLRVEIESDLDAREPFEPECGAAWVPVSVTLTTDDGELETTEQGWLMAGPYGEGAVRIEEPSFGGGEIYMDLDPEAHSFSSSDSFDRYHAFDACCLAATHQSFSGLLKLDELGLIELEAGAPDVVGQDSVELSLRVSGEPISNSCFEEQKAHQPITFELIDAEGTTVASGTGSAEGARCPSGDGCIWVQVHGDGHVSDASYLGAEEPLKGEASRVFLEAQFISCETPALFELGISVDVQLEEYAIEMGLTPAPSSGISPPTESPRDRCF